MEASLTIMVSGKAHEGLCVVCGMPPAECERRGCADEELADYFGVDVEAVRAMAEQQDEEFMVHDQEGSDE